jgi:hypothetical protein
MRAWNAGHAAVTVRLTQFQWNQASAVRLLLSTRSWGERAVNVRAALNPPIQLQRKAVAVADTWLKKQTIVLALLFSVLEWRYEKRLVFSLICVRSRADKIKETSVDWPDK